MSAVGPPPHGMMRHLRAAGRAAAWTLGGTVLLATFLEGASRLAGTIVSRARTPVIGPADARRTVLCEGDSFTFGIGGVSYPVQLEQELRRRFGEGKFRVVNLGVPGQSTAGLSQKLDGHLDRYRPDVVVVLSGDHDVWSTVRLPEGTGGVPLAFSIDQALLHSKVYRFAKLLWLSLRYGGVPEESSLASDAAHAAGFVARLPLRALRECRDGLLRRAPPGRPWLPARVSMFLRAHRLRERGEFEPAASLFRDLVRSEPDEHSHYEGLADSLLRLDRHAEAIEVLEAGKARPAARSEGIYLDLAEAYRRGKRFDRALAAWEDGLAVFPRSRRIYEAMARAYDEQGDLWKALALERGNPALRGNSMHHFLARLAAASGRSDVSRLVAAGVLEEVRRMEAAAARAGAKLVFVSYPDREAPHIRAAAAAIAAPFVDLRPVFRSRFKSRAEYVSPDQCHCNTEGYRAMAEVLAETVSGLVD